MISDHTAKEQETVKKVYEEIADEYDERIPGATENDRRFTETEQTFLMSKINPSDHVLDMGCGTGRFTIPLAKIAAKVTGLDMSAAMLKIAEEKADRLDLNIDFHEGDMAHLPFEDHSFDAVVCMLAIMHIPPENRERVFLEASRVLKPGGRIIISAKNSLFERLSSVDRFAAVDKTDVPNKQLIFTNTQSGHDMVAPWYSFSPQDFDRLFALAKLHMVHLRGNIPLSAWLADSILTEPAAYEAVKSIENILGDIPPFNYLGYHILAEAVKPV
jgi:ubiquinone/menaquinone biosynthesis C-methylase UbiE